MDWEGTSRTGLWLVVKSSVVDIGVKERARDIVFRGVERLMPKIEDARDEPKKYRVAGFHLGFGYKSDFEAGRSRI